MEMLFTEQVSGAKIQLRKKSVYTIKHDQITTNILTVSYSFFHILFHSHMMLKGTNPTSSMKKHSK